MPTQDLVELFDTPAGLYAVMRGHSPTPALHCPCGLVVTVRGDTYCEPQVIPGQLRLVA